MIELKPKKSQWGKRKFRPGGPFEDIHQVINWIQRGGWIYWGGVPKHPSIIQNMSLTTLLNSVGRSGLRPALRNGEDPE